VNVLPKSLTVVIPAYNEEASLEKIVVDTLGVVRGTAAQFEIIIVDDGSTDGTRRVAEKLVRQYPEVRVVSHERNLGSGAAIKTGVAHAACEYVIYVPADDQFNIREVDGFLSLTDRADIVIGVRLERSDYSWFRLLSSRVFIALANFLFGFRYKDVNWVHLWRREAFQKIRPRSKGVFMLEEILVRADRLGYKVAEIDSGYRPRIAGRPKGCSIRSILTAIYEMGQLWLEMHLHRRRR